jgi:hypothetical protein
MLQNFVASPKNRTVKLKGGEYVGFARKPRVEKTYFETTLKKWDIEVEGWENSGQRVRPLA